jgi:Uma2 family endonuclease
MSPTGFEHGRLERLISKRPALFVEAHDLGEVAVGEVGIYTRRNPDTVRGADVVFISHERLAQRKAQAGFLDVAPELVVEVLSPGDTWSAVTQKLKEYFAAGVKLVWVADPSSRSVYTYRSPTDVREFAEADELTGDDVLPGLSIRVGTFYEG